MQAFLNVLRLCRHFSLCLLLIVAQAFSHGSYNSSRKFSGARGVSTENAFEHASLFHAKYAERRENVVFFPFSC